MSIPSDRRSVSSILNNLIGRVRVLEALPQTSTPIYWASARATTPDSVASGTPTALTIFGADDASPGLFITPPSLSQQLAIEVLLPGMYYVRGKALFDDGGATYSHSCEVYASSAYPPVYGWDYYGETVSEQDYGTQKQMYVTEWFDIDSSATFPMYVSVNVVQGSGAAMDITGELYVARVGDATS